MGEPQVQPRAFRSIPFLDLKKLFEWNREEYVSAMTNTASEAAFIGGATVEKFEREFAAWIGPEVSAAGCGNGTDAIQLAARALQLPEGSEAIIPAMTFVATAEGLLSAGLQIRLVDVCPKRWVMDLDQLESSITERTRLIVPVHLYGQMAEMDRIREIADRHGCFILEDAAQAHGAKWKSQPVGYWGDASTYSFFPGKNLGAFGDGGAVTSRSRSLTDRASALAKHGGLKKYEHLVVGQNSRLDALQAAVLRVKMNYIDGWTEKRRAVADRYRKNLSGIEGLELPEEHSNARHVYHLFVVLVNRRESFQSYLADQGVATGVHYPKAVHQLPAFEGFPFAKQKFENAERLAAQGVSLPMCPTLTNEDIDYVSDKVRAFFEEQ